MREEREEAQEEKGRKEEAWWVPVGGDAERPARKRPWSARGRQRGGLPCCLGWRSGGGRAGRLGKARLAAYT